MDALVEGLIIYAKTGKMPTALGDIPGTWKDPMSPARGLHLKSGRDTLRIYSTGVSAKDHGGVDILEVSSENLSAGDYDLAAGYPPVRVRVLQRQPSP